MAMFGILAIGVGAIVLIGGDIILIKKIFLK